MQSPGLDPTLRTTLSATFSDTLCRNLVGSPLGGQEVTLTHGGGLRGHCLLPVTQKPPRTR